MTTSYRASAWAAQPPSREAYQTQFNTRLAPARPRRWAGLPGIRSAFLVAAGLTTLAVVSLSRSLVVERGRRTWRRNRSVASALAVLGAAGLAGLLAAAVVVSFSGVHVPGQRTLHAVLSRIPQLWRAARPAFVPSPETADADVGARPAPAPLADPPAAPAWEAAAPSAAPPVVKLEGFRHQWQTWNNCGPATITMAVSYYGRTETQARATTFLKTSANDKNVRPDEMVAYARSLGLQAVSRAGGDLARLKLLVANGVPVVVHVGFEPEPNDWMGHYRLLVGYDDTTGRFTTYDSYKKPGVNVLQPYDQLDADWRVFNRTYIPVYAADKADLVAQIIGPDWDDRQMHERALAVAQGEAVSRPADAFAWFNVGTNLVALGRAAEAAPAFDRARALKLPWRMLWYQFGPFEAYLAAGRPGDVLTLAGANLQQSKDLEESHFYLGRARQTLGQIAGARASYEAALRANGRYTPAHHALASLG